jgi:hypothetical protein
MTDPIRAHFPDIVDSTILDAFRSCPQKAFREYVQHWKNKGSNVHLHAGAAYATGIEAGRKAFYVGGKPLAEAEAIGLDALGLAYGDAFDPGNSPKSKERMMGALDFYWANYPMDTDSAQPAIINGRTGIEFSFAEPLPVNHPVTGEPIIFSGRADSIMNFAGGIYLEDDKTTSSLGQSWPKQWEMRGQFSGYAWAAREIGIPITGIIVRGVSILKTKYDHMQALTYRSPHEIDRWYEQTVRDLERMVKAWHSGVWDWNMGEACNAYGSCKFTDACKSPDPDHWIRNEFEQRVWNPLLREELPLELYIAKSHE